MQSIIGINTEKGQIFSIDGMVAIIVVLIVLMIFSLNLNSGSERVVENIDSFYLEEKVSFIADSFVKNNKKNSLLGAAVIDFDKKRTISNYLSKNILLKSLELDDFFVKKIIFGNKEYLFEGKGKECLSIKRFVLINGEKNFVIITGCLK